MKGTFISDQYHYWKYRACSSPFHCCFGNSSNCFRSIFAFQKRDTDEPFFRNALENVVTLLLPLVLNLPYSQSSLAEWKQSCRPFCGAAGGSRAHCSSSLGLCLNWKQRWEACGQLDNGPAQSGLSAREAEIGHSQPRILPYSHLLWSSICILSLALRA